MLRLFFATSAYCGLGITYNRKKLGKEGIEAIPNLDAWKELPGLVKVGCHAVGCHAAAS